MRRADRLFQIVQLLRGGRRTTAKRLAERLEVSERTIYRDIADLQGTGVPIEGEAGFGYVMDAGFDIPPLMFSREEIKAVRAGVRLIRAWGGAEMALAAEEALQKIEAVLPEDLRGEPGHIHVVAPGVDPALRARLDAIEAATDARQRLTFGYRDKDGAVTERTVRPLGLWFWGQAWTLVAWCEMRHDFRMFRVDRLQWLNAGEVFRDEPDKTLLAFYRADAGPRRATDG